MEPHTARAAADGDGAPHRALASQHFSLQAVLHELDEVGGGVQLFVIVTQKMT